MPRKKRPGANYKKSTAEDVYYHPKEGPPLLVRDPTPRKGLLEFQDCRELAGQDAKTSYVQMCVDCEKDPNAIEKLRWIELFVVCAHGNVSLYRPECMFTGYTSADCLASIPVDQIFCAGVDTQLGILDFHTQAQVYRFRSQQQGDVARWQHAIMQSATPGMERLWDDDWDEDEEEDGGIWKVINQRKSTNGGLESALAKPADKLEKSEEDVLLELFCTIGDFGKDMQDKDNIDGGDLIKWCANRMNLVKDKAHLNELLDMVTSDTCEDAMKEAMIHDTDHHNRVTFDVFKRAMCDFGSPLRKIVLAMLHTFPDLERWQYLEAIAGQLSKSDYILMYHMHMVDVVKACRNQLNEERDEQDVITNNKKVAQVWLQGVEDEVATLLKKFDDYNAKLRAFVPSLRERVHSVAIDDVFDDCILPGKRWDSCNPRKSWK